MITRFLRSFLCLAVLLLPLCGMSQGLPSTNVFLPLHGWSFADTNWLNNSGYGPLDFTNIINSSNTGDYNTLMIDGSNTTPAYLFYNIVETNGSTNIMFDNGSISLWFKPDWSSPDQGGSGPGDYSVLISAGQFGYKYAPWWSLFFSPDGGTVYFSSQTNYGSESNYLSAPISLSSSTWYNIVLTYSATNTALYANGTLITNGTGVAFWPGPDVTFFTVGSDADGYSQAQGQLDDLFTYSYPLDPDFVQGNYGLYSIFYMQHGASLDAFTNAMPMAPTNPAPRWFQGTGFVQYVGSSGGCVTNANVWITNVSSIFSNGLTSITFTIAGGSPGLAYDVYGTTDMAGKSITNAQWAWLGQGNNCSVYTITNLPYDGAFITLGTPQDTDNDGLPDAFEALVSKTNPTIANTYSPLPDAWIALNGLAGSTGIGLLDPDFDGLNNYQEFLYGSKPLVNEGTNIWIANPSGYSAIP